VNGFGWSFVWRCDDCSAVHQADAEDVDRTDNTVYSVTCLDCGYRRVLSALDLPEKVWMLADLKEPVQPPVVL
jgi:DNA-directed RNA polymerase subunit RPC12/RpoP